MEAGRTALLGGSKGTTGGFAVDVKRNQAVTQILNDDMRCI